MKNERPDLFPWAVAIVLFVILSLLFIGGCNTIDGAAKDIDGWITSSQEVEKAEQRAYYLGQQGIPLK